MRALPGSARPERPRPEPSRLQRAEQAGAALNSVVPTDHRRHTAPPARAAAASNLSAFWSFETCVPCPTRVESRFHVDGVGMCQCRTRPRQVTAEQNSAHSVGSIPGSTVQQAAGADQIRSTAITRDDDEMPALRRGRGVVPPASPHTGYTQTAGAISARVSHDLIMAEWDAAHRCSGSTRSSLEPDATPRFEV